MTRRIYITGLLDMPRWVRELAPSHLISAIQPELQPPRPAEIDARRHLRLAVHDVSEPDGVSVLVSPQDMRHLLDFAEAWSPAAGSLLVHCYAGVSRSTAIALVVHTVKTGDPTEAARALREAAPHASPNRRIVSLADAELGLGGELVRALDRLGPPAFRLAAESLATLAL